MMSYKEKRKNKSTPEHLLLLYSYRLFADTLRVSLLLKRSPRTLQGAALLEDYGPGPWPSAFLCKLQGFCILHRSPLNQDWYFNRSIPQAGPLGSHHC